MGKDGRMEGWKDGRVGRLEAGYAALRGRLSEPQNERSESERGGSKAWNWRLALGERSESLSGEAPQAWNRGTALCERSESLSGEAPQAWNRGTALGERSESLSGEAPAALLRRGC